MNIFLILILWYGLLFSKNAGAQLHPDQTQHLIKKSFEMYEPLAQQDKMHLTYIIDMGNAHVAAYADVKDQRYILGLYGGLLTSPRLTYGTLAMTLCHELGHIFGGSPRRPPPPEWDGPVDANGDLRLSAEGQADYYSTASCFRQLLKGEDHRDHLKDQVISPRLLEKCKESWPLHSENYFICLRAGLAALDFLNLTKDFDISLEREDTSEVTKTIRGSYPPRQCRLDTMVAGALCKADSPLYWKDLLSPCVDNLGKRPACWFKD